MFGLTEMTALSASRELLMLSRLEARQNNSQSCGKPDSYQADGVVICTRLRGLSVHSPKQMAWEREEQVGRQNGSKQVCRF